MISSHLNSTADQPDPATTPTDSKQEKTTQPSHPIPPSTPIHPKPRSPPGACDSTLSLAQHDETRWPSPAAHNRFTWSHTVCMVQRRPLQVALPRAPLVLLGFWSEGGGGMNLRSHRMAETNCLLASAWRSLGKMRWDGEQNAGSALGKHKQALVGWGGRLLGGWGLAREFGYRRFPTGAQDNQQPCPR